jgi:molecular chaperone DnaK
VTPLSLGIETLGGVMTRLIDRNTTIPTRKSEVFSTAADNQTSVEIHVLQGEREMARDNRTLGKFQLIGIPSAPRGIPQVEVTFDIDANGILNVSAKDKATGKQQAITITASSGLAKDDVEKMVKDAEAHGEEDKRRRQEIELRNQADALVYGTEKTLSEHRDKIPVNEVGAIETALKETKAAMDSGDMSRLREKMDLLTKASHRLAEIMYQQTASKPKEEKQAGGASGQRPSEDVVDAEFEEKK